MLGKGPDPGGQGGEKKNFSLTGGGEGNMGDGRKGRVVEFAETG